VALATDGTIAAGRRDDVLTPAALTRAFGIDVGWAIDVARGVS
jgi:ABC-type cobalamin transport system ATPase subunit